MAKNFIERDQQLLWHPYTQAKTALPPIMIERGEGCYLYTSDNQKLFDGISSWWTNCHGHCNPHIAQAIEKQLSKLEHVIFASFTHEPAINLAEQLINVAPKGLSRVYYSDNGSTAVEIALKMAFQYWQHKKEHRPYFVALEHSYHGDTFGAMSVSERGVFTKPFWPLLFNILTTPAPCISQITKLNSEEYLTKNSLNYLLDLVKKHDGQIAGIIIEPMLQASAGMRIFTKGFLRGIRKICDENKILLIADEVATGFYRTGKYFACDHEQISPDLMCLSKGLTGGFLPLAATLATDEIFSAFLSDKKSDAFLHGHTFTGNPLACAAAVASMELFSQPETKKNIDDIVHNVSVEIRNFKNIASVKNARSIGCIGVIELSDNEGGYLSQTSEKIYRYCFNKGLYIRPLGNVVYFMPPLCATAQEVVFALGLIKEALEYSLA